jgi:hypothetical protein
MAGVNVEKMMSELGIEGFGGLRSSDDRLHHLINAALVGFSDGDGDIEIHHDRLQGEEERLFGVNSYNDGIVAPALAKAALYHDPLNNTADI